MTYYLGSVAFMLLCDILLHTTSLGGLWRRVPSLTGPPALSRADEVGRKMWSKGFLKAWQQNA